jgi:hypothetical protein
LTLDAPRGTLDHGVAVAERGTKHPSDADAAGTIAENSNAQAV